MVKVAVVGVGNLGSCIAYEVASRGLADELLLIDVLKDLAEGQATDIEQAIAFRNNTRISFGGYEDAAHSDLVVIAAGRARTPDMRSRLELLNANSRIIKDVASSLKPFLPEDCVVVTMTNPLDIMNFLAWRHLGLERLRVIGSSGQLDSARFRAVLARRLNVRVMDVEAYAIGEHGESQAHLFSQVRIKGKPKSFDEGEKEAIRGELRDYAIRVVAKKGATVYAPASNTADMVQAVLKDERRLMCCSTVLDGEYGLRGLSIGVPVILGRKGLESILEWALSEDEEALFRRGAEGLKGILKGLSP